MNSAACIITGAARGLGFAFARRMLLEGHPVSICDVDSEAISEAKSSLAKEFSSNQILSFPCDVSCKTQISNVFVETKRRFSNVSLVVNNAGTGGEADYAKVVAVNLVGVMHGTVLGLEHVCRGGSIVNVGSASGLTPTPLSPAYSASKHGVVAFTRAMADKRYAGIAGIRIMCLCPSFADTEMVQNLEAWVDREDLKRSFTKAKSKVTWMSCETVAEHLVDLVREGQSGDVWLLREGLPATNIPAPNIQF